MVVDMNKIKEGMTNMNKHDMFIFTNILGPIILFDTYSNLFQTRSVDSTSTVCKIAFCMIESVKYTSSYNKRILRF